MFIKKQVVITSDYIGQDGLLDALQRNEDDWKQIRDIIRNTLLRDEVKVKSKSRNLFEPPLENIIRFGRFTAINSNNEKNRWLYKLI